MLLFIIFANNNINKYVIHCVELLSFPAVNWCARFLTQFQEFPSFAYIYIYISSQTIVWVDGRGVYFESLALSLTQPTFSKFQRPREHNDRTTAAPPQHQRLTTSHTHSENARTHAVHSHRLDPRGKRCLKKHLIFLSIYIVWINLFRISDKCGLATTSWNLIGIHSPPRKRPTKKWIENTFCS